MTSGVTRGKWRDLGRWLSMNWNISEWLKLIILFKWLHWITCARGRLSTWAYGKCFSKSSDTNLPVISPNDTSFIHTPTQKHTRIAQTLKKKVHSHPKRFVFCLKASSYTRWKNIMQNKYLKINWTRGGVGRNEEVGKARIHTEICG